MKVLRSVSKSSVIISAIFIIAVCLFAGGTRFRGIYALTAPVWFDEAYNLQLPTRLVKNGEYSSFPRTDDLSGKRTVPVLFDPVITTGPFVLLPIALGTKLSPNEPIAITARRIQFLYVCIFVLLLPIGILLRTLNPLAALPALIVGIWMANYGYWAEIMNQILGEGPGVVYFVAAVLTAYAAIRAKQRFGLVVAGALAAGSIFSKLIFFLGWAGAFLYLVWAIIRRKRERLTIRDTATFIVGFFGTVLLIQLFEMIQLGGFHAYVAAHLSYVKDFFAISGGPLSKESIGSRAWFDFSLSKFINITHILRGDKRIFASLVLSVVGIASFEIRSKLKKEKLPGAAPWKALVLAALVHHAWFVLSSPVGWPRHYLPAMALLVTGATGWFLELIAARFSPLRLSPNGLKKFGFALTFVCLGCVSVRMKKPVGGGLAAQQSAVREVTRIENEKRPLWVVEMRHEEGVDSYALFADADVTPNRLNPNLGEGSVCEMMKPDPDKTYALLTRAYPKMELRRWKCPASDDIGESFVNSSGGIRLEVCPGARLFCGS